MTLTEAYKLDLTSCLINNNQRFIVLITGHHINPHHQQNQMSWKMTLK